MRNSLLLLVFFAFSSVLFSQTKLTCLDFAKGEFKNISDENPNLNSQIIRKGGKQLEITNGVQSYKKIQWLNDCSYILTFPKKEAKKDKFKLLINKTGGITVTVERIEEKTLYYKTVYFDGKKNVVGTGKMIKLKSTADFR